MTLAILCTSVMAAFAGPSSTSLTQTTARANYAVTIYVSNQTGELDPVNIMPSVDHRNIVNGNFSSGSGHNWSGYKLALKEGEHQLIVTSDNGDAGLDVVFVLDKPLSLIITYWGKNHFQLNISPRPVGFATKSISGGSAEFVYAMCSLNLDCREPHSGLHPPTIR